MAYVDSAWGYESRTVTSAGPSDSAWGYSSHMIDALLVGDSPWAYKPITVLSPGKPNLVLDGAEVEADWSIILAGVEKAILNWSIILDGQEVPLTFHGGGNWEQPAALLAGANPVGSQAYPIPASNVIYLSTTGSDAANGLTVGTPKATLQAAINAVPAGGTIIVREGVYRAGNIETTKSFTLQNYPGEAVWFDGSVAFGAAWTQNGSVWTAPYSLTFDRNLGKTADRIAFWTGPASRVVVDQVWLDNTRLYAVADGTTPGPGQFSVNQGTDTLTIGSSPAGKAVRVVDLNYLFAGSGATTIRGIGIRRYAPAQIEYRSSALVIGAGSLLEQVVIEHTSLDALSMNGNNIVVRRSTFQDCGHTPVQGDNTGLLLFEQNLIRRGNRNAFDPEPTTAGFKITRVFSGVTIKNNHVQDIPNGTGIWFDTAIWRSKVVNNTVIGTSVLGSGFRMKTGIGIEGCDGGFINGVQYYNYLINNRVSDCRQGGVILSDNGWIKVWNNTLSAAVAMWVWQDYRENTGANPSTEGTALQSPWHCRDIDLTNNNIVPESVYLTQIRLQCNSDAAFKIAGGAMLSHMRSNWLKPNSGGLVGYISNAAGTVFAAPSSITAFQTLAATYGGPLAPIMSNNYQGSSAPSDSLATPLPAEIASILQVPTGLQKIGPILLAPVPVG